MVHIISIGIDCGIAELLRKHEKRTIAYPFDWNVTYGGVGKIFQEMFRGFLPTDTNWNPYYGTWFMHDSFPDACEKYVRRIYRLVDLLQTTTEPVIFIRKCHAIHNHEELYKDSLCNEIEDAVLLDQVLKQQFSQLHYKIVVILICNQCYSREKEYHVESDHIKIYNIATDLLYDEENITNIVLKEISI